MQALKQGKSVGQGKITGQGIPSLYTLVQARRLLNTKSTKDVDDSCWYSVHRTHMYELDYEQRKEYQKYQIGYHYDWIP